MLVDDEITAKYEVLRELPESPDCDWQYDDVFEVWDTKCGKELDGNAGPFRPWKHCPYCGKSLIIS